jgi:hypothetical protein
MSEEIALGVVSATLAIVLLAFALTMFMDWRGRR